MTAHAGVNAGKQEHLLIAGGVRSEKLHKHCRLVWCSLRKLGIDLPRDAAIPLLGLYPKDSAPYYRDTCSSLFIGALDTISRNWEKSR